MTKILTYLITVYQNRISPYKGFTCAHKGLHGDDSCSEFTKNQLLNNGVFNSIAPIKKRFRECRDAADIIKLQRPPISQRGDCDLGIGGCIDVGSCGGGVSSSSSGNCFYACGDALHLFDLSKRGYKRLIIFLSVMMLIALVVSYYYYGRQIDSVDIRINPDKVETTDSGMIAKLFRSQQPDYKINFELKSGSATTNVLKNRSAKEWISLKTTQSFYLSDINQMIIVDKELTKSKPLESIPRPSKQGKGELFEYSIKQKWDWF